MALFLSTYANKVDKKGRVSIPALFRSVLQNENFHGIVAYPSFVDGCIEACGMQRIERLSESIDELDPFSDEHSAFAVSILGESMQLSFDGEGRVVVPEKLLQEAGISDQAVFVGKGKTFQIWSPEKYEEYANKARDFARKNRGSLSLHGRRDENAKRGGENVE